MQLHYVTAAVLIAIVVGVTASCRRSSVPAFDPPRGTWDIQSMDKGGGPEDRRGIKLVWTSTDLYMLAPNGETKAMGRIVRLDQTKTPAEIDLELDNGLVAYGIFEASRDSMKLIIPNPGVTRPEIFQGRPEAMLFIVTAPSGAQSGTSPTRR